MVRLYLEILKQRGNLCFITSNKWMRAGYGEKLREFFVKNNPVQLVDFGGFGVFDSATVDVNILLIEKNKYQNKTKSCTIGKDFDGLNQMSVYIRQNSSNQIYTKNTWCILNPIEQSIKEKIERIGTPLKDWDINIYRGVLTGLNEAFIIDGTKKDELIAKDPKSVEIIRPILRGRDIKRYSYDFADKWLINTHNGSKTQQRVDVNNYPAVKEHLDKFLEKLVKRDDQGDTPYNLRCCAYTDDFSKQKIIWKRIGSILRFSYDDNGCFGLDSTCFITGKHIKYLVALLNSQIGHYMLKDSPKTGTGDLLISVQAIEPILVANITEEQEKIIDNFVQNIIEDPNSIDIYDKKINNYLFEIYNLSQQEIKYIENLLD